MLSFDLYPIYRETYALWKNICCPKQGSLFNINNRAKARFKDAIRYPGRNDGALRKNHLPKSRLVKMTKHFGKKLS